MTFFPFFSLKENKIYASLSGIKQTAHINKDISFVFLASYEISSGPQEIYVLLILLYV